MIHDLTVLHTDLHIDLLIDTILVLATDHVPTQETITLLDIQIHIDHLQDQEILNTLDLAHTQILGTKLIWYNHKTNLIL